MERKAAWLAVTVAGDATVSTVELIVASAGGVSGSDGDGTLLTAFSAAGFTSLVKSTPKEGGGVMPAGDVLARTSLPLGGALVTVPSIQKCSKLHEKELKSFEDAQNNPVGYFEGDLIVCSYNSP